MRIQSEAAASGTYGGRFTGAVEFEMLQEAEADGRPDVARVRFIDGAVTNWHRHPGGQHLLLVEGHGRIGTDADGEVEVAPGAFVAAPAGERHYHGAARGRSATWVSITFGTTRWEDVAPGGA